LGPASENFGRYKYYVSFIDDYSKFTWIYLLKKKSDVFQKFRDFQHHVERLFDKKIIDMQSDWGGEYQKLNSFFQKVDISHLVSCPHAHQQNEPAKRKHRHIIEVGLSLLAYASMPLKYWDEAFSTAVHLINRLPSRVINSQTPMEHLFGSTGDYSLLRIFCCACWPNLRPYNNHKLQFCSKQCVFVGYSSSHKGYKCLDISSGRLYISRDVVFDETVFPFASLHDNVGAYLRAEINLLPLNLQPITLHNHEGHELQNDLDANLANPTSAESVVQESDFNYEDNSDFAKFSGAGMPTEDDMAQSLHQTADASSSGSVARSPSGSEAQSTSGAGRPGGVFSRPNVASGGLLRAPSAGPHAVGMTPAMFPVPGSSAVKSRVTSSATGSCAASESLVSSSGSSEASVPIAYDVPPVRPHTRSQDGIVKPKIVTDGRVRYDRILFANFTTTSEPSSLSEALMDSKWKSAMDEEYSVFMKNNTWHLFLLVMVPILLIVSGCTRSSVRLMALLIVIKLN
jgi:hypothetical protein